MRRLLTAVPRAPGLLAAVVLATGCASQDSEPPAPRDSLRIARPMDVRSLDPLRQANNATSEVTYQIHESLVTLSPEQELVPGLATAWELLDDGVTYRITLREGVRFHSGEPFDARAVAWNFERQLATEPLAIAAGLVPPFESIDVVDENTIDVTLEEPNGVFMNLLAAPLLMMVDPTRYEGLEEDYARDPSGTGPFRFVSWSPDRRIVLEANPDYWNAERSPEVSEVVFEVIPEAAARIIALRNDEIDMVFGVPAEDVEGLAADPDVTVVSHPSMRIVYVGLNTADPVLSDVRVRRALGHATDRDEILRVIGANGVRADGIGTPEALGFAPSARDYDPDEATRLPRRSGLATQRRRAGEGRAASVGAGADVGDVAR